MIGARTLFDISSALQDFEPTTRFWWQIGLLGVLLILSGFFSSSEIALFRMSAARRRHLFEAKVSGASTLDAVMRRPNRLLITILFCNNLVNIGAAALATSIAIGIFGDTGVGIATGVMTLLILIVGEMVPKAYAAHRSQRVALATARPLRLVQLVLLPFIILFEAMVDGAFRLVGARRERERTFLSSDEFRTMIDVGTEEGVLEEEEQEMLHGVISFGEVMAKEVMVPRPDMVALPAEATVEEALAVASQSGFSRLPVYKGTHDHVVGVLYAKDLLGVVGDGRSATVGSLMRPCVFIPETNTLDQVLAELQDKRVHLAIVVDEYGDTSGIVTMEDLLEEIVGDIFDEYDLRREAIRIVDNKTAIVDARSHVDDVNAALDTHIPEDAAFETVGGFVYHALGRLAQEGETFEAHGLRVRIEKVSNRRILRVRFERLDGHRPDLV